jgi:hypothetical protein
LTTVKKRKKNVKTLRLSRCLRTIANVVFLRWQWSKTLTTVKTLRLSRSYDHCQRSFFYIFHSFK